MPKPDTDGLLDRCSDPTCGDCGKPLSKHYHEYEIFCNAITNGNIFTDEPSECKVFGMIEEQHPGIIESVIAKWKRDNGHTEQATAKQQTSGQKNRKNEKTNLVELLLDWYYGYHKAIDAHKADAGNKAIKPHFLDVYLKTSDILGKMRQAGKLADEQCSKAWEKL